MSFLLISLSPPADRCMCGCVCVCNAIVYMCGSVYLTLCTFIHNVLLKHDLSPGWQEACLLCPRRGALTTAILSVSGMSESKRLQSIHSAAIYKMAFIFKGSKFSRSLFSSSSALLIKLNIKTVSHQWFSPLITVHRRNKSLVSEGDKNMAILVGGITSLAQDVVNDIVEVVMPFVR